MKISFKLNRRDEWLKAAAIRTGENAPREVYVDVDSVALGETRRAVLVECYQQLPDAVDELTYNKEYQWNYGRYNTFGRFYLYSDAESPGVQDVLDENDECILMLDEKRKAYLDEEADRKAAEARREAEAKDRERKLVEAKALLSDELEELKTLKKKYTLVCEVLSEVEPSALSAAVEETGRSRQEVVDACDYPLNFGD